MTEIVIFPIVTSLTANISTTSRPVTFTVAATSADLGAVGAVFSCLIYDAGTDADPQHAEALQITSGGGTLSWTGVTETGSTAFMHTSGDTVIATIITPRSLAKPLVDHINPTTTPDPHSLYILKTSLVDKGYLLAGNGSGVVAAVAPGSNGATLITDSTVTGGIRWAQGSLQGSQARTQATAAMRVQATQYLPSGTNTATPLQIFGGLNGASLTVNSLTELTTITASATTLTSIQIPAGCIVLAIPVRTVTTIPTATTYTVTGNSSGTFSTGGVGTTASNTDPGTAAGAFYNASAQAIKFTPNSTPGSGTGQVRVTIFYLTATPPTS